MRHIKVGSLVLYCTLKTQGLTFRVICGPVKDEAETAAEYTRVCAEQLTISPEDQERIWQESEVCARTVDLLRALLAKGFKIPDRAAN